MLGTRGGRSKNSTVTFLSLQPFLHVTCKTWPIYFKRKCETGVLLSLWLSLCILMSHCRQIFRQKSTVYTVYIYNNKIKQENVNIFRNLPKTCLKFLNGFIFIRQVTNWIHVFTPKCKNNVFYNFFCLFFNCKYKLVDNKIIKALKYFGVALICVCILVD